jgi:RND family efflux transporter MFP subunit
LALGDFLCLGCTQNRGRHFERKVVPHYSQDFRLKSAGCWGLLLGLAVMLQGCEKPAATAAPLPAVTVAHPLQREVIEWDAFTGHLEAPESVSVAARVSGLVMETPFVEGSIVKKGDLLFVIDDRPFKADLESKRADEAKAEAQLAIAELSLKRQAEALKGNAVSQQDYDNAKAARDQAAAVVGGAKAAVELSELNLEWCKVTSPINGRVSNKLVTVGNLVNGGAGQATLLTTVQSVSPIYCYIDVDEHSVLKYQELSIAKKRVSARDAKIPCYLQLSNETGYPHTGVVDFVDNHVDPTTGTLRARGIFRNQSGLLTPGFFASMRIPGSGRYQALLIPDTAIGADQSERNVLVVKDDVVVPRIVQLGALFGGLRSIVGGLNVDDQVIINGQMHARPGGKVTAIAGEILLDPAVVADSNPAATQPATEPSTGPSTTPTMGSIR